MAGWVCWGDRLLMVTVAHLFDIIERVFVSGWWSVFAGVVALFAGWWPCLLRGIRR
jgi:hypothetical protein